MKRNRYCVIDIGTNSIRMLIAEYQQNFLYVIKKDMEMTRIGKGVDETKLLSQRGMDETIKALKLFKQEALRQDVSGIYAIATSAVRDAKNKNVFIEKVKREMGIDIEVISGKREAELGFKGILGGVECSGNILAIDIGGGSTELILGNDKGISYSTSIDVGAVRLTDRFITTDPIRDNELEELRNNIQDNISNSLETIKGYEIDKIVGIGGTITTLAAIKENMGKYNREKIHNSILNIEEIRNMIEKFVAMTIEERKKIKGLQPKRADIIISGAQILYEILKCMINKEIIVSDYDNLEGAFFHKVVSKESI